MKFSPKFGVPTDPVLNEQILRHAGKISYASFQVSGVKLSVGVMLILTGRCWSYAWPVSFGRRGPDGHSD